MHRQKEFDLFKKNIKKRKFSIRQYYAGNIVDNPWEGSELIRTVYFKITDVIFKDQILIIFKYKIIDIKIIIQGDIYPDIEPLSIKEWIERFTDYYFPQFSDQNYFHKLKKQIS